MCPEKMLRSQLLHDLERLGSLIQNYAFSLDPDTKRARDPLEGAVQVKFALLQAAKRAAPQNPPRCRAASHRQPSWCKRMDL